MREDDLAATTAVTRGKVHVRITHAANGGSFDSHFSPNALLIEVKERVEFFFGVGPSLQILIFNKQQLTEGDATLNSLGMETGGRAQKVQLIARKVKTVA